jgi:hypothetical protein
MPDQGKPADTGPIGPIPGRDPKDTFSLEDERWAPHRQRRDWMWLGLMIVVYCAWTLIVYLLEPGLR